MLQAPFVPLPATVGDFVRQSAEVGLPSLAALKTTTFDTVNLELEERTPCNDWSAKRSAFGLLRKFVNCRAAARSSP